MERGLLTIIPDENQILKDEFTEEVKKNHLEEIQKFSDEFKLDYNFEPGEYQDAPCILARDGHLVFKTVEDSSTAILYLPEVVTDRQINWLYENKNKINNYQVNGGYAIKKDNSELGFAVDIFDTFDMMFDESIKRNFKYQMKGNEDNVGRKTR